MRKLLILAVLLAFACALTKAILAADTTGKIIVVGVKGTPQIIRDREELFVQDGAKCELSDRIRTDASSQADIVWGGRWGYRLLASSECRLASLGPNIVIQMAEGDIVLNVKSLDKEMKFSVETPTAVATVRGTQFWGHVGGVDSQGTFAVRRGVVDVTLKGSGLTYSLKDGDAVDFTPESKEVIVRPAKEGELRAMLQSEDIPIGPDPV